MVVPCLFIFSLLSFSASLYAAAPVDVPSIIEKAGTMKLYEEPYWRTLLHYKPVVGGGYESLVDDPKFFFAKDGKKNPKAELAATLTAFFTPKTDDERHPTSRFPARYAWLREKLGLDASVFPYDGDQDYRTVKKAVNPGTMYLVFPAGYMKNPASMFGHTFLLIESKGKSRLLAYAVNYGAVTGPDPAPLYALKGLIGSYRGYYSFLPYYQKIREYSDIDMRDMWEYRLNLSDKETDRLLRHTIEMEGIYSNYYFISENCSYNLLFLIEAAKPETKLTDAVRHIVEPLETVKLVEKTGLTGEWTFRPSLYARIEYLKSLLSSRENSYVKDVCFGKRTAADFPFPEMTPEKQAILWDLSSDYLKYLLASRKISSPDYRVRILAVLSARKDLGRVTVREEPPVSVPPHTAHGSSRIAAESGKDAKGWYSSLEYRLLAHETMDTDSGYTKNSQLAFCRIDARYRYKDNSISLRSADLADIISLPVSDTFFFNAAFAFRTGLETNAGEDGDEHLAWRLKFSYGTSIAPTNWSQLYVLGGFDTFFSPTYDYGTDLLLGGETGLITTAGLWKGKLAVTAQQSPLVFAHTRYSLSAEERFALSQNLSLCGSYFFTGDYGDYRHEYALSLHICF